MYTAQLDACDSSASFAPPLPSEQQEKDHSEWTGVRGPACGGSVPFMKSCLLREALSFLLIEIEGTDKGCGEDAKAPGSSSRGHPWRKCLLRGHLAGPKWGEPLIVEKHCCKTVPANLGSYPHFRDEETKAELGVLIRSATIKWAQCQAPEFFKVIFTLSPSLIQPISTYSDASRRTFNMFNVFSSLCPFILLNTNNCCHCLPNGSCSKSKLSNYS